MAAGSAVLQPTPMQPRYPTGLAHPIVDGDPRGQRQQFFPTPAQAMEYQQSTGASGHSQRRSASVSSSVNPEYNSPTSRTAAPFPPSVPLAQHYPSQYATDAVLSAGYASSSTAGDRFLCEKCNASFGRQHDRKRHYETHHLSSPPVHRCQYCRKEFSRGDSLKRHLDNGCDAVGNN